LEVQLTDLPTQLQALFTSDADAAALACGLIVRQRKLTAPAFAQGLVFGWLENPDASSAQLVQSLARAGVCLAPQSLDDRFTDKASFFFRHLLDSALARTLAAPSRPLGLLARFNGVHITDATSIALPAALAGQWPGCRGDPTGDGGKAAMKILVRYEVSDGTITGLSLHQGKASDNEAAAGTPYPKGSLRLADLGFFDFDELQRCEKAEAYYLTRVKGTYVVYDGKGRKWKLARYLARQKGDRLDRELWLGQGKKLKGRLLAIRAPQEVAAKRRKQALESARDHGLEPREETLSMCGWTVFFTNVPRWLLTLQEAWVMYRVRWQIELLFKTWKSDGKVEESRSGKAERVLCEVCAKLLGAIVQGWLLVASAGAGMAARSKRQAAQAVRGQVGLVAAALHDLAALVRALGVMAMMVTATPGVRKRKGRPATFQTLLEPYNDGLSAEAGQDPRSEASYDEPDELEQEHPASPNTHVP
jgi:hypothetical protein